MCESVCVCTSSPTLGGWQEWQAITLHFLVEIHASTFKFCVYFSCEKESGNVQIDSKISSGTLLGKQQPESLLQLPQPSALDDGDDGTLTLRHEEITTAAMPIIRCGGGVNPFKPYMLPYNVLVGLFNCGVFPVR